MQGSDDELMVAIVAGDRDAFAALYRRRRPDVYRFAVHMTGEPALAEDVTHDVFLAVIESAQHYTAGRSGVVPWLLGIARNQARRRLSRDWRLEPLPEPDDQQTEARAEVADPLEDLAREREIGAATRGAQHSPGSLSRGRRAVRSAGAELCGSGRDGRMRHRNDPIPAASWAIVAGGSSAG